MTPTKTLLLVEDEALVRHDLKEGLVEAGFDVSDVAQGGTKPTLRVLMDL
jgi:DNA-binding response OmpR family regulator